MTSKFTWNKAKSLQCLENVSRSTLPLSSPQATSLTSSPHPPLSCWAHCAPGSLISCCSSNVPSTPLPQGLCTGYSFCLNGLINISTCITSYFLRSLVKNQPTSEDFPEYAILNCSIHPFLFPYWNVVISDICPLDIWFIIYNIVLYNTVVYIIYIYYVSVIISYSMC